MYARRIDHLAYFTVKVVRSDAILMNIRAKLQAIRVNRLIVVLKRCQVYRRSVASLIINVEVSNGGELRLSNSVIACNVLV